MATRIEFHQHGEPKVLKLQEFTPADPQPHQLQIENKAIGVNYLDTYLRTGLYPVPALPSGIGSEAAGVVRKTGAAVSGFKPGDRVVYAQAPQGAYSSLHNVPAISVAHLPDEISFEQAAAAFLKGLTVFYLLHKTCEIKSGDTFVFHAAAGGVGLIACQWAKVLGARLIGTTGSAEKAHRALNAGAWQVVNYRQENLPQRVQELTEGKKVPVVYDSVGKDTWLSSLDCLQPRGLMVSFGNASGPVTGVNLALLNQKGSLFVTRPSLAGYITSRDELDQASSALFSLIASGAINVDVPSHQCFALQDAQKVHQLLESRATQGSCLLIP